MDIKSQMIEAIERGWTTNAEAYSYVRDRYADRADRARKTERENRKESGAVDEASGTVFSDADPGL